MNRIAIAIIIALCLGCAEAFDGLESHPAQKAWADEEERLLSAPELIDPDEYDINEAFDYGTEPEEDSLEPSVPEKIDLLPPSVLDNELIGEGEQEYPGPQARLSPLKQRHLEEALLVRIAVNEFLDALKDIDPLDPYDALVIGR